ncbi:MAG: L-threonylcarbamoyladenylate synthase [Eggerthellaceae bacterium]|jgi:tRNA threonylcarbamoyl adenosine modification protein (Sua5/YciO/YrdC/YwlC family)
MGDNGSAALHEDDAVAALRRGEPVILPTDTVFGLAVAPRYADGPDELYRLKGRPSSKPVAWLVGGTDDLDAFGTDVPAYARVLAQRYWPGPLTLIVRAGEQVPRAYSSAERTIGLRMPDDPLVLRIIGRTASPLACTSANPSGDPAPMRFSDIDGTLASRVPAALDDAQQKSGVPSTVVDCTGREPRVLRQGTVTAQQVADAFRAAGREEERGSLR